MTFQIFPWKTVILYIIRRFQGAAINMQVTYSVGQYDQKFGLDLKNPWKLNPWNRS